MGNLPLYSEDNLALTFARDHHLHVRYVETWKRWYFWDGTRWAEDTTLRAFDLSREICRHASKDANEGGKSLASHSTVAAVAALAKSDRRLVATRGPLGVKYAGRNN
jgi:hypothetical protein